MRPRLQATLAFAVALALWAWRGGFFFATVAGVTGPLAALAWLAPAAYAPVARTLDRFAHGVLIAFTWTSLAIVYFGVFTPLRLWRAMTGADPLQLRPRAQVASFLQPLPPAKPGRFDRMF